MRSFDRSSEIIYQEEPWETQGDLWDRILGSQVDLNGQLQLARVYGPVPKISISGHLESNVDVYPFRISRQAILDIADPVCLHSPSPTFHLLHCSGWMQLSTSSCRLRKRNRLSVLMSARLSACSFFDLRFSYALSVFRPRLLSKPVSCLRKKLASLSISAQLSQAA